MRIPISTKLIVVTVSFLVIATGLFATQSSELFESEMVKREEAANHAQAEAKAIEINAVLDSSIERVKIIGALLAKHSLRQPSSAPEATTVTAGSEAPSAAELTDIDFNFDKDMNLVAIEVYKLNQGKYEVVNRKVKSAFFTDTNFNPDTLTQFHKTQFPLSSVFQKNIEIQNATLPKGPPLFTIGVGLFRDENGAVTHIAVADLKLGVLQATFAKKSEKVLYLVNRNGELLAHQDETKALARLNYRHHPLVAKALADAASNRQVQFKEPDTAKPYIGAYQKTKYGPVSFAQTDLDIILEPAKKVRNDAIRIAGRLIAVALLLIFFFSMTLTKPIETLAELIALVSKGNFDVKARSKVKSHDEVGDLAVAFDNMTEGLKERDKVKNLFSKFHGSSIAEDLIKNDIGVGGSNKEVTVFFSDIRGFTAFSENRTPEEVVEMLNEYFEVMVGIINKNNGVVDKFIGDAIMAVWGAPHGGPKDTQNALKACLEMRKALWDLNKKREVRGQIPIKIGMGLHSGHAISGTIGSSERMEYTVIGDTVNMTSRIESSTKAFGTDLLVSETVANKVAETFLLENAGSAEVKGKSEPLKLFKVRGYKNEKGEMVEITTPYSDFEAEHADKVKVA